MFNTDKLTVYSEKKNNNRLFLAAQNGYSLYKVALPESKSTEVIKKNRISSRFDSTAAKIGGPYERGHSTRLLCTIYENYRLMNMPETHEMGT